MISEYWHKGAWWIYEHRPYASIPMELSAGYDRMGRPSQIRVRVVCPFCEQITDGYLWSMSGSGKKCGCGSLLSMMGASKRYPK